MAAYSEMILLWKLPVRSLFLSKQKVSVCLKHVKGLQVQYPGSRCGNVGSTARGYTTGNDSHRSDEGENHDSHKEQQDHTQQENHKEDSEASIKHRILDSALDFVPAFSWSVEALSEGAKAQGFPGVAHGMFPRGGGDLVHHFVYECNAQLADKLAKEVQEETEGEEKEGGRKRRTTVPFIRDALEARLRMIIPYVNQWPQAMAMTAIPANTREHFTNLMQLMDDVWYHAGDRSTDFNWYTKRVSLAAIYKSAELCLVQDKSTDFQETWMFIDRRLDDFKQVHQIRSNVEEAMSGVSSLMTAAVEIGRNIAGINSRDR